jgi:hypothetical protein
MKGTSLKINEYDFVSDRIIGADNIELDQSVDQVAEAD